MAGTRCAQCGREEFLPFRCRLCEQPHCLDHRLPENHSCHGLGEYRSRAREERVFSSARDEAVPVKVRGPSRVGGGVSRVAQWFTRSMTHRLLAVLLAVYAVQWLGGIALSMALGLPDRDPSTLTGPEMITCQLALGSCDRVPFDLGILLSKPWSPATALVAHALNPFHLFFNVLFLYFFGTALEQRVGSKMLLSLFVVAGLVAGFAQAIIFPGAVLGASGGLMGVLGTLTILAPNMRVIFWFFPIPLWIMTIFFALLDLAGVFSPEGGIANLAHLAGLAVGIVQGERLRRRGVMPRMTSWASQRRL